MTDIDTATGDGDHAGVPRFLTVLGTTLDRVARWLAGAGLLAIIGIIVLQVLFRYLLNQPLAWTEEVSRFLFFGTSLIAITVAHRRMLHAGYSSLVERLPTGGRRVAAVVADAAGIAFYLIIGFSSRNLIEVGLDSTSAATGTPMFLVYLIFPLCALFGTVFCLEHLLHHLAAGPDALVAGDDRRTADEAAAVTGHDPDPHRTRSEEDPR